ncbi:MAG: [Fe-Fe] hydrogenase large subunit C-terminal domain-containing protein [Eubacteriales bacterium]|nr:[Fe-Fe] hydrogenase large subunit C-terminal domain-containing protein [Eubacteriales bacterium]MDD4390278.1 [Fe-Fe] hydrogenase large subunit C-terminal domain-containing protein [Eubacteriales bacterium]
MHRYNSLEKDLKEAVISGTVKEFYDMTKANKGDEEIRLVDALMYPDKHPIIITSDDCSSCETVDGKSACEVSCLFGAIKRDEGNNVIISGNCTGCGDCIDACPEEALTGSKDSIAVMRMLKDRSVPVYAMIAPAFTGQFTEEVNAAKLRCAFKRMGFYGMVEVALFADILTLKEALEFDREVVNDDDFLLTSCCCPLWVAVIRKQYENMVPHVPPSVSPMVACGRSIKKIHPDAKTVFIGPCMAKKAEAREKDIIDAVDYVLTFEEADEIFKLLKINPKECEEDDRDHSSKAGRIYARATGVSEAVQTTLDRLRPDKKIRLKSRTAEGMVECKQLLKDISEGNIDANFMEGMGCRGGCVGGPKSMIDKEIAREAVNQYGDKAEIKTPADNPFVLQLLNTLGYETVESLLERDNNFTRSW